MAIGLVVLLLKLICHDKNDMKMEQQCFCKKVTKRIRDLALNPDPSQLSLNKIQSKLSLMCGINRTPRFYLVRTLVRK